MVELRPPKGTVTQQGQEQGHGAADQFALAPALLPHVTSQAHASVDAGRGVAPPQRPRREGDEAFTQRVGLNRGSPIAAQVDQSGVPATNNVLPPPSMTSPPYRNVSPPPPDGGTARQATSITSAKTPPADAFYYGTRSPTSAGFPNLDNDVTAGPNNGQGSLDGYSAQLAESERRNATLRAALEQAIGGGTVSTSAAPLSQSTETHVESPEQVLQAALAVQERLSAMKVSTADSVSTTLMADRA